MVRTIALTNKKSDRQLEVTETSRKMTIHNALVRELLGRSPFLSCQGDRLLQPKSTFPQPPQLLNSNPAANFELPANKDDKFQRVPAN